MIFILDRVKLAALGATAISFLVATPALALDLAPRASAQSDAVKSALNELEAPDHELTPLEQFLGVLDVLEAQVTDLEQGLNALKGLDSDALDQRAEYLSFLSEVGSYLIALRLDAEVESVDIKFLAEDLKLWKEEVFDPEVQEILNFSLVFQARSVLKTAESRYLKIRSDVEKLMDLKILSDNKAELLLTEALLALTAADTALDKAEQLLEDGAGDSQIRKAVSLAIAKIKIAYKKFLDISYLVKTSLK